MTTSCSTQCMFVSSPSASAALKPKFLGLNNHNTNVFGSFIYRVPNLATLRKTCLISSRSPLAVKCSTEDVKPTEQQDAINRQQEVILIDGLQPAVLSPSEELRRDDFPSDFKFGASTSALQTEGSGVEGGRGESTWDDMIEASQGMKGADSYNLYKEDVKLLKDMGMNAYRFSIAWPRILPQGTTEGGEINQEGIDFYDNFIDELIANGITPVVTLFHFDLPVALQKKYNGFLDRQIVGDFGKYADICFKHFGDRVKYWSTINEPFIFGSYGYKLGLTDVDAINNPLGPYIATHNIILAHAHSAQLYRHKYQKHQKGKIGISLPCKWFEPRTINPKDVDAARKQLDFMLGWYMDPFINGDYPTSMKKNIKGLPKFTKEEAQNVKTSCDFIGINYYTARFAKQKSAVDSMTGQISFQYLEDIKDKDGNLIGEIAQGQDDIYIYPDGLRKLLLYVKEKYHNPEMYITENGVPSKPKITRSVKDSIDDGNISELEDALFDYYRISHAEQHLTAVREAIKEGANVKGYFVWSLMDNMEVGTGYDIRYGLNYVDYCDKYKRYPKLSSKWFALFLSKDASKTKNLGLGDGRDT